MVKQTLIKTKRELDDKIVEDYEAYTDKYFLRAKTILKQAGINPMVRYQVFARQDIQELRGVDEAAYFIRQVARNKARIYALKNGQGYKANTPLMKIEGRVQDLVDLETVYLGIIAGELTGEIDLGEVRKNARAIKKAARDKVVLYFGARHFASTLDEKIAKICQEEGFAGCSTDIGARAWNAGGGGTIPHALVLAYKAYMEENNIKGNPTVEAARGFDRYIDKKVPRVILIDTFNREITDTIETAAVIPNLKGWRIDTCGENYIQDSIINLPKLELKIPEKYIYGRGVKIVGVWGLRKKMDEAGHDKLTQTVSSGFNEEKTAAFIEADKVYQELYEKPLFEAIGTGSLAKPIMTTSDICAYFNEKQGRWLPLSKTGRNELNGDLAEK